MKPDYSGASLIDLEALLIATAKAVVAHGESASQDDTLVAVSKEIVDRSGPGQEVVRRLLGHHNPEVRLSIASRALEAGTEEGVAMQVLEEMSASVEVDGWYNLWAQKALVRRRYSEPDKK